MPEMTDKQRRAMQGYLDGNLGAEIAAQMGIAERTLEFHRQGAIKALGAKTLPQAVAFYDRMTRS